MFWPEELTRGIWKMSLGLLILAVAVGAMFAYQASDFFAQVEVGDADVGLELLKAIISEVPFLGLVLEYLTNMHDVSSNFLRQGGYGVLHDFSKSVLLFFVVHFSVGFIKGACKMLGDGMSPKTPYGLIYQGITDIGFGFCICMSGIILMLVLHGITLNWWLDTFGNGSASNWGYLIVLLLLVAIVYLVLPEGGRKSLVDELGIMLTDLGIVICAILLGASFGVMLQGGAGGQRETIIAILVPYILSAVGLAILLPIRFNNTKSKA